MWSGSIASIPSGWALCNGTSGTPDLQNQFIVGAGNIYAVAAVGGSANAIVVSHTHTASSVVSDPGHAHSYIAPTGTDSSGFGGSVVDTTVASTTGTAITGITVATTINSTGSSATNANLPPYYALAYIMKL
jgi:microcystin-dependent protein